MRPGTRKSYMIKQMHRHDMDVVISPFRALNAVYPAGQFASFTAHRSLTHNPGTIDTVYCDEFTVFDFRAMVALCGS